MSFIFSKKLATEVTTFNDLKLMLDETKNMTDDQIKQEIIEIAKQYNVTLTDTPPRPDPR